MSHSTFVNYQRPSQHEPTKLCICCLERDVTFVNLSSCSHSNILELLCSVKIPEMELGHLVCCPCHAKLKNIQDFKLQAEEAFTKLSKQEYTVTKRAPTLKAVHLVNEKINLQGIAIKCEPYQVTAEYAEVLAGNRLSNQPSLPSSSGPHLGWDHEMTVQVKKEVDDDLQDCSDDDDDPIVLGNLRPGISAIPTKVTNYHLEVSGLLLNSRHDNGAHSDLDSGDEAPLATIKQEVETEPDTGALSDQETDDMPLASIKQEREIEIEIPAIKAATARKNQLDQLNKDFPGAIKMVTLTHEEIILERERDRHSEIYLRNEYRCETCIISFGIEQMLLEHNANRHQMDEDSFQCNICASVFPTLTTLRSHEKKTHKTRFECIVCETRFPLRSSLIDHYLKIHRPTSEAPIKCNQCDYSTTHHGAYKYHREKYHLGNNVCIYCSSNFSSKSALVRHIVTKHENSKESYPCELCDKTYTVKHYLRVHIRTKHGPSQLTATDEEDVDTHYCAPCNRVFKNEKNLKYHLRFNVNHRGDKDLKRFTCDTCGKKFDSKGKIRDHIAFAHMDKIQYTCPHCTKNFEFMSALNKHIQFVHDKLRPPKDKICDYCGMGFSTTSFLRNHIRKHTDEKPFLCSHCPARFKYSGVLYSHIKLKHKKTAKRNEIYGEAVLATGNTRSKRKRRVKLEKVYEN